MIRDKGLQLAPAEPGVVAVLRSEPGALQTKGSVFAFQKQEIKQQDESLMPNVARSCQPVGSWEQTPPPKI